MLSFTFGFERSLLSILAVWIIKSAQIHKYPRVIHHFCGLNGDSWAETCRWPRSFKLNFLHVQLFNLEFSFFIQ